MSIIIKGMDMPKNCTHCDYIGLNVAIGCPVMSGVNGRATDCPLIEIPEKHGRLIEEPTSFSYGGLAYIHPNDGKGIAEYFAKQVKSQPTVFEAEEQE